LSLLRKRAETMAKLRSFICVEEISTEMQSRATGGPYASLNGDSRKTQRTEFRTDGNRYSIRCQTWGNVKSATVFIPEDRCPYNSLLWDGKTFIRCVASMDTAGTVTIDTRLNEAQARQRMKHPALWGSLGGRAEEVLGKARNFTVRTNLEQVGQAKCHVIDAVTPEASYSVWIDPERGDNIVQATILFKNPKVSFSLERVVCKEIAGTWIPVEGYQHRSQTFANGDYTRNVDHLKIPDITLNPDPKGLGPFVPDDIKNGALVEINPGLEPSIDRLLPVWQDGRVVDKQGRVLFDSGLMNTSADKSTPAGKK
jgi:hypothetical protein